MNKFVPVALLATLATFTLAPAAVYADEVASAVQVSAGKMLYGANGQRIAAVYRVTSAGDAQVIINGKLYTVPASSLSEANGKVTSSLTKKDVTSAR